MCLTTVAVHTWEKETRFLDVAEWDKYALDAEK
jgi:hypothetical protein